MKRRIYFDNAATTAISPIAAQALAKSIIDLGNPSSLHGFGREVRLHLENAREEIASALGALASEVIFTGSGTEANNTAIKGLFWHRGGRKVIITTAIEHHASLDPIQWLAEHEGAQVRYLNVDRAGVIDLDHLQQLIAEEGEKIAFISFLHTNNEIGTAQDLESIARIIGEIPLHIDAVQSIGKVPFDFHKSGALSAAISAHKVGGPLGVGALLLRHGNDLTPLIHGGGQEREIRSGTLNAPGIIAFAAALTESRANFDERSKKVRFLREEMIKAIKRNIPDATINGRGDAAGIINVTFPGTSNEASLLLFDSEGIATSTGSACSQGVAETSHVLTGIGLSESEARASLRFSLNHLNTLEEIGEFESVVKDVIERARAAVNAGAKR